MRPHPPLAAAAIALVLLVAGCSSSGTPATAPSSTSAPTGATTPKGGTTEPPEVGRPPKLLDAGKAPRRKLRLAYVPDATGTTRTTTSATISVSYDGRSQTSKVAPSTATTTWKVIDADDTGAQVETVVVDAPASPDIEGITTNVRVSLRGEPDSFTIAGDDQLDEAQRALLRSTAAAPQAFGAVLPVQAVGVGASWRVLGTTQVSGIEMQTTTTFHLDAIDGNTLTYHADVEITADDQPVTLPSSSAQGHLQRAAIGGTTEGTMRLDQPSGTATSTVSGTEDLEVKGPKGTVLMHQDIQMTTSTEPVSD